jgi:hypothetical protein
VSVARLTTQLTPAENSQEEGMGDEDWQIIVYDMLKSTPTIPLDVLIKTATEVVKESKDEDTISRVVIFLQQTIYCNYLLLSTTLTYLCRSHDSQLS